MLYYLGIANLPGKKAHSIQEMRMTEAFAATGQNVVYIHGHSIGRGGRVSWSDVADHYGLETEFTIKTFHNLYRRTGRFTKIGTLSMACPQAAYVFGQILLGHLSESDIIYGRNYYPLYFLSELLGLAPSNNRPYLYFEFHDPMHNRFENRFFRNVDGVVCITQRLADYTVDHYPIDRDRVFVAPDGVSLGPYEGRSRGECRRRHGIPDDEDVVMYTGHLYEGKGVETLVRAASGLDATLYVVGGYEEDIDRVKRDAGHPENVIFTGFVEPGEIPSYQIAADVLVAPYTEASREFVSPLKLFEYMAAGNAIVASDRAILREVLCDEENASLFEAGNERSLRCCLRALLTDDVARNDLAAAARESVTRYTWTTRAKRILDEIGASPLE